MNSLLHNFLSQLKDKELLELTSETKRWHRGALIGTLTEAHFDEGQWKTLKELESNVLERRKAGKCINPETGRLINLDGPTYERLSIVGYNLKLVSIEVIRERAKYPKVLDKVVDDVSKGKVDLYEEQLSAFSDELLLFIAGWLDRKSLACLCSINKRFFLLSEDPSLNRILCGEFEENRFSSQKGYAFYLDSKGKVYTWGQNRNGSLGLAKGLRRKSIHVPFPVDMYGKKIRSVITSHKNTAFVTTQGRLYLCGSNTGGTLGIGKQTSRKKISSSHVPIRPLLDAKVRVSQVVLWNLAVAILSTEGHLYVWGRASPCGKLIYQPERFLNDYNIHKICASGINNCLWVLTDKTTLFLNGFSKGGIQELEGQVYKDVICPSYLDAFALKEISEDVQAIDALCKSHRYGYSYRPTAFQITYTICLPKGIKVAKMRRIGKTLVCLTETSEVLIYHKDGIVKNWDNYQKLPLENVQDFYLQRLDKDVGILLFTSSEVTHFYRFLGNNLTEIQTDNYLKGKGVPFDFEN